MKITKSELKKMIFESVREIFENIEGSVNNTSSQDLENHSSEMEFLIEYKRVFRNKVAETEDYKRLSKFKQTLIDILNDIECATGNTMTFNDDGASFYGRRKRDLNKVKQLLRKIRIPFEFVDMVERDPEYIDDVKHYEADRYSVDVEFNACEIRRINWKWINSKEYRHTLEWG